MTQDLATLIARRPQGHSLEAPFYVSQSVFDTDMEKIFAQNWLFVASEAELPDPGDTLAFHIGPAPILLLRDPQNTIRAYHNVCRHRGAQLIEEGRGHTANLVCRYHAWTYAPDGQLLHAPHMGETFDPTCRSLKPIALRAIAGLLFICLAENPPPDIEQMAEALTPYLRPHGLQNARVAHQTDLIEEGNWKLTLENNRECYHCAGNHPELTVPLFAQGFGYAPEALDPGEQAQAARYEALVETNHKHWEENGLPSRRIEHLTGRSAGYRAERLPLDQAGESHTIDTRAACRRLMGALTNPRAGGLHVWTQPNSWHHFMSDHAVTFAVFPLAPNRTLLRTTWLVHQDAIEGVDYDRANLVAVWEATNRQDAALVEMTQAGVQSPAYQPGPYSPHTEGLVEQFCQWYLERLGAEITTTAPPQTARPPAEPHTAEPHTTEPPREEPEPQIETFALTFAQTGQTIACPPGRTVLAAARLAGIRLPSSCGQGVCGTCKTRLRSGTVTLKHGGGITDEEIQAGYTLLCRAKPTSDLVIDR